MEVIYPPLLELGAALLSDPLRLVQVHRHHRQSTAWGIPIHRHDDLLQMDLAVGFGGTLYYDRQQISIGNTMAMTFYPGVRHGFELIPPQHKVARFFSLKIRVSPEWRLLTERPFPPVTTQVPDYEAFVEVLTHLERAYAAQYGNGLLVIGLLLELLALWPMNIRTSSYEKTIFGIGSQRDERIEQVIELIEHHLSAPLSLEQMAEAVGLSPRHLTRLFMAVVGRSPHAYVNHRRLVSAQEMLVDHHSSVTEVAQVLAFPSIHAFSRWFTQQTGLSPRKYRESHRVL